MAGGNASQRRLEDTKMERVTVHPRAWSGGMVLAELLT